MKIGKFLGCHQLHSRSFFIKGYQFPICARCTGVFVGEMFAISLIFFWKLNLWLSLLLLIPLGIDWGVQHFFKLESTNSRRFISGLLAGFGLTFVYYYLFAWLIYLFI